MKSIRITGIILASAILFSGCSVRTGETKTTDVITSFSEEPASETSIVFTEETTKTEATHTYKFNRHLYSEKVGDIIPKENYDALYNLIDALCEGKDTFECSSKEAYKWATDDATLNNLFPPACMKVTAKSTDGSTPFENGVGRIYLKMSSEEFIQREKEYEAQIEEILNTCLEDDDDDFEKAIKLYNYMETTFTYGETDPSSTGDGADYKAFQMKTGVCDNIASIYAYLLKQAGVEALNIGTYEDNVCHAWTYAIIKGKSYHIDATWALKKSIETEDLYLDYFMMSDRRRTESGCPLNDITVPLLPKFWANNYEGLDFKTADDKFDILKETVFIKLDEVNKILYYKDFHGKEQQLSYA